MNDVTISYKVRFRKREGSALVAVSRADAPGDARVPAALPHATARDTAPQVAADASQTARLLALAHRVERMVVSGELRDYREAAARLGICHARMSQITAMLLLSPTIQADILLGRMAVTEGGLRRIVMAANWEQQIEVIAPHRCP